MDESNSPDHLSSSLTDLMTSLMVIFILLLLVFITRTAIRDPALTDVLLKELIGKLTPQGFPESSIQKDKRDPTAILLIVPDRLMNFEISQAVVKKEGQDFLAEKIPMIAAVLCDPKFRDSVESIVVEGHTDRNSWTGTTRDVSQTLNLKLSQDRSMSVVQLALADLVQSDTERACFLEKLSATGRGDQDCSDDAHPDECRRVIFRIRVKAKDISAVKVAVQ